MVKWLVIITKENKRQLLMFQAIALVNKVP
jgi:hypothetical protein